MPRKRSDGYANCLGRIASPWKSLSPTACSRRFQTQNFRESNAASFFLRCAQLRFAADHYNRVHQPQFREPHYRHCGNLQGVLQSPSQRSEGRSMVVLHGHGRHGDSLRTSLE